MKIIYQNYYLILRKKCHTLTKDNIILNLLVKEVAKFTLNTIKFDCLSIAGLRYLLACTLKIKINFYNKRII